MCDVGSFDSYWRRKPDKLSLSTMSKYSKAKLEEIDAKVRKMMAVFPNISAIEISKRLGYYSWFINKRKSKIERENAEAIRRSTIEEDLGGIKAFLDAFLPILAEIIFSKDSRDCDKINAVKTLITGKMSMLERKFDAGIYERQLGTVKTEERMSDIEKATMERALEHFYNPDRPAKIIVESVAEQAVEN